MIIIVSPHQHEFLDRWLRSFIEPRRAVWVPVEVSFDQGHRMRENTSPAHTGGTGETVFSFNPSAIQITGRAKFNDVWSNHIYNLPVPEAVVDESDPKIKNKVARKKREANKASHNARGRKWWEHR